MNQGRLNELLGEIELLLEHLNRRHLPPDALGVQCEAPVLIYEAGLFLEEARTRGLSNPRMGTRAEQVLESLVVLRKQLQAPPMRMTGSSLSA